MKREEFFERAVIEISAALMTQPGAWKQSLDKAIEMAQYLTTQVYGEHKPCDWNTPEI